MKKFIVSVLQFIGKVDETVPTNTLMPILHFFDTYESAVDYATYKSDAKVYTVNAVQTTEPHFDIYNRMKDKTCYNIPMGSYKVDIAMPDGKEFTAFTTIKFCNIEDGK